MHSNNGGRIKLYDKKNSNTNLVSAGYLHKKQTIAASTDKNISFEHDGASQRKEIETIINDIKTEHSFEMWNRKKHTWIERWNCQNEKKHAEIRWTKIVVSIRGIWIANDGKKKRVFPLKRHKWLSGEI